MFDQQRPNCTHSNGNFQITGILDGQRDAEVKMLICDVPGKTAYCRNVTVYQGVTDEQIQLAGSVASGPTCSR